MSVKPKNFRCEHCMHVTYQDYDTCLKCGFQNTIKPISKKYYICYLNGEPYGTGDLEYMGELFKDYVVNCKMYDKKECEFKIVEVHGEVI